jgi:hypothetical protein
MAVSLSSTSISRRTVAGVVSTAIALSLLQGTVRAQPPPELVTVLQYRHVPAEHVSEFLYRETTYWSKVAQKAVDSRKMTFWALLEQVGGHNLPNSPNYLFINTVPNVDALGDVFNPSGMFPGIPMSSVDTDTISTTTGMYFLSMADVTAAAGADPARDFRYLALNYHNSSSPSAFIGLEREHWLPFIKAAMDKKQTAQVGWTNGHLIAPRGNGIGFNTVSVDLYPSLQKALMPGWASDVAMPGAGLDKLNAIRLAPMGTAIYRIVHVVSAN